MARTRTLAELRADAYKAADQEAFTDRFPAAEVTRYINQGISALWDLLVAARGDAYFGKSTTLTSVADQVAYDLPSDFYKTHQVHYSIDGGQFRTLLQRLPACDEAEYQGVNFRGPPLYYRERSTKLDLFPAPSTAGESIYLNYVPYATQLSADGDTFDGVNGWEDYVVFYAARRMAQKDSDIELVNLLQQDMNKVEARVQRMAQDRNLGTPEYVQDTRGALSWNRNARFRGWK